MSRYRDRIGLRKEVTAAIRPRPPRDSYKWMCSNIRTPEGTAFNGHTHPWVKGICAAWDNPDVRRISLQFAARLGKTMTAMGLMASSIEYDPAEGMVAFSTQPLLKQTVEKKYYPMFDKTPALRHLVYPPSRRTKDKIDLITCRVNGAYSGSDTSLSDKEPKYKHAGEIDKWDRSVSTEADPFELWGERGIERPDRKEVCESTPDLAHTSRINRELLAGWNCRFLVPCPECKKRIQLIPGHFITKSNGEKEFFGGIKFDKNPDGRVDPAWAYKTARYQCQICKKEWGDLYRRPAIMKGVWCPEGMRVTPSGLLRDEMVGDYDNASFQLSRLYAPTFKFADIARQIARCVNRTDLWHNTRNSWFGEVHHTRTARLDWDKVGERLSMDWQLHHVPEWGIFLCCGVDVQEDHFVFVVMAFGKGGKSALVDYGHAYSKRELKDIIGAKYHHRDGGPPMGIELTLIDSGSGRQDGIIEMCYSMNKPDGPWVWPLKGSTGYLQNGMPYKDVDFKDLESDKESHEKYHNVAGFKHVTCNTPLTQWWAYRALNIKKPETELSFCIPQEVASDEDFLRQLINESIEHGKKTTGHDKKTWVVVDTTVRHDFRDSYRYCYTAGSLFIKCAWTRLPERRRIRPMKIESKSAKKPRKQSEFIRGGSTRSVADQFIRGT